MTQDFGGSGVWFSIAATPKHTISRSCLGSEKIFYTVVLKKDFKDSYVSPGGANWVVLIYIWNPITSVVLYEKYNFRLSLQRLFFPFYSFFKKIIWQVFSHPTLEEHSSRRQGWWKVLEFTRTSSICSFTGFSEVRKSTKTTQTHKKMFHIMSL